MVKFTKVKGRPVVMLIDNEARVIVNHLAQLSLVDVRWLPSLRRLARGGRLVGWLFLHVGRTVVVDDDVE